METQNIQANQNSQATSPSAIPGVMDLVKETIQIFSSRFKLYLPFYTIMFVGSVFSAYMNQIASTEPFNMHSYWLVLFLSMACNMYATITLVINLADPTLHIDEVYRRANKRLLPYIGTIFLAGFIIMIGFLLLIIPGILFSFWYYLAAYIVILENTGVRESLSKSKTYMKEEGWSIYVKGFLAVLVLAVPVIILTIILATVAEIAHLKQTLIGLWGTMLINSILNTIYTAAGTIAMYLIYSYIRKKPNPSANNPESIH